MANVANKITRTVKKVTRKATKTVGKTVNAAKYSVKLKAKQLDLDEKFEQLGKLFYEYKKNENEENKTRLDKCIAEIDVLNDELLELRRELAKAKNEIVCPNCGAYVSPSKDTCPSCDGSLERIEVTDPDTDSDSDSDEENN